MTFPVMIGIGFGSQVLVQPPKFEALLGTLRTTLMRREKRMGGSWLG